jgi:hypothetical protein
MWQRVVDGDIVSTLALRDALRVCGYAAGKDALAVLRSAFRSRPSLGAAFPFTTASGQVPVPAVGSSAAAGDEHAAILTDPLASFIVGDEDIAMAILAQVDNMSHSRSGRVRPPSHPTASVTFSNPAVSSAAVHNSSSWGAGSLAASVITGGGNNSVPRGLITPQRPLGSVAAAVTGSAGRASASNPGLSAALPGTLGDWIRRHATDAERSNLVALMGLLGDFQARNGLPSLPMGAASGAEGADTVVVPLGPSLKVGLRVYV